MERRISAESLVPRLVLKSALLGVTKRCRPSWLTNSALVYEPKCRRRGGVAGSQPMSTAVHRSPNTLWRSHSIFNLCHTARKGTAGEIQ
jgi:hypothetical protein